VEIKKAVITAAGEHQRMLPLQTLVDRDSVAKSALCILVEEVLSAGIEELGVVVFPGDQAAYRAAAGDHAGRLTFIEQPAPLGYADAVACGGAFAAGQPFLLLVGDHLYVSQDTRTCAQQLVEAARQEECSVSAVQATHESKLPYFGAVGGRLESNRRGIYRVETVIEKPTPTEAEQKLMVPGLRAGYYLCFFGMHVLSPLVIQILSDQLARSGPKGDASFSAALAMAAARERYLAVELRGRRYDIGAKYGLLITQMALALQGRDRDEVLATVIELLASQNK
jgi:UTP--glucose-1-phosphate uridylyltransferase